MCQGGKPDTGNFQHNMVIIVCGSNISTIEAANSIFSETGVLGSIVRH